MPAEPGPPGILGTPSLSSTRDSAPPQEGKGSQLPVAYLIGTGPDPQDERVDCCRHHLRWVLGPGASLHWGSAAGTAQTASLSLPSPSAAPLQGGGGGQLGDAGPHTLLTPTHGHTNTQAWCTLASPQPGFSEGWALSRAATVSLPRANLVSSACPCQAGPWIHTRWSSRTRTPMSASPALTFGPTWGSSWKRLPLPGGLSLCLRGPAPQSPPGSCSPPRRP